MLPVRLRQQCGRCFKVLLKNEILQGIYQIIDILVQILFWKYLEKDTLYLKIIYT